MDTLITLSEYCELHDIDYGRARRLAKRGKFPGASKMLGVWAIDKNAPIPELPDARNTRDDGRKRYIVYLNDDELKNGKFDTANVVDVRERAKQRRAAKRAAQGENAKNE